MNLPAEIARHVRQVYFGGNWSDTNFRDTLKDIDWRRADAKIGHHNSIAALVFHLGYYTKGVSEVLREQPLTIRDKFSFANMPLQSEQEWQARRAAFLAEGEIFAALIEQLPAETLATDFTDPKYGHYHTNLWGMVEHLHYHLGQVALLKKLLPTGPVID